MCGLLCYGRMQSSLAGPLILPSQQIQFLCGKIFVFGAFRIVSGAQCNQCLRQSLRMAHPRVLSRSKSTLRYNCIDIFSTLRFLNPVVGHKRV